MALFSRVNGDSRVKRNAINDLDPSAACDREAHRHRESEIYDSKGASTPTCLAYPALQGRTLLESTCERRPRARHSSGEDRAEAWTTAPSDSQICPSTRPI